MPQSRRGLCGPPGRPDVGQRAPPVPRSRSCRPSTAAAGFAADLIGQDRAAFTSARFGVVAYVARAIMMGANWCAPHRIEVDGAVHDGHAATVMWPTAGSSYRGVLSLADDIAPDDGVFDVAVLDAASYASALPLAGASSQRRPDADAGIRSTGAARCA